MSLSFGKGRIGTEHIPDPGELAQLRVQAARRNRYWTEVPDDFVARPYRLLVSASTDQTYRVYRGATFAGAGRIQYAEDRDLAFVVRDNDVVVLEPMGTWSEILAERGRRAARAGAR